MLILESCFICVSIAGFNTCGVATTKYASAPQRSTIDTSRTVLIWLFCMIVPSKNSSEYWGKIHVDFKWLQLVGFILLVIGTLLYNEIIVLPFAGFDQNTKSAIEGRKKGN